MAKRMDRVVSYMIVLGVLIPFRLWKLRICVRAVGVGLDCCSERREGWKGKVTGGIGQEGGK